MSGLSVERTIEVAGRSVTVRELTVAEIRAWMADVQAGKDLDLVAQVLLGDATLDDVTRLSDLAIEDLNAMTPSQIRAVLEAAKELNADFFGLRARIVELARAVPMPSEPSSGPSPA